MYYIVLFFLCSILFPINSEANNPKILVSITPYKFLTEQIAGNTLDIEVMVPPGGSPHTYEPSTKTILFASEADLWFRMGEMFEDKALEALQGYRSQLKVIDLREGLPLIYEGHCCAHHHNCADPHVWLSPKMSKIQAEKIAQILIHHYPKHQRLYEKNLTLLKDEIDQLDKKIQELISSIRQRTMVVSHPAYAYFCRDYDLKQLSIEFEGKEPSSKQLTLILNEVRKIQPKVLFVQAQHLSKGAKLIANQIGAKVVEVDPLAENYFDQLVLVAKSLGIDN